MSYQYVHNNSHEEYLYVLVKIYIHTFIISVDRIHITLQIYCIRQTWGEQWPNDYPANTRRHTDVRNKLISGVGWRLRKWLDFKVFWYNNLTSLWRRIWPLSNHNMTIFQLHVVSDYFPTNKVTIWPFSNQFLTIFQQISDHNLTIFQPITDHNLTIFQPITDHNLTIFQPITDHNLTIFQTITDHNLTIFSNQFLCLPHNLRIPHGSRPRFFIWHKYWMVLDRKRTRVWFK